MGFFLLICMNCLICENLGLNYSVYEKALFSKRGFALFEKK